MPHRYNIIEESTSIAEETLAVYPQTRTIQSATHTDSLQAPSHDETKQRFQHLFAEWERNVGPFSDPNRLKGDSAFKAIVSIGDKATPYLLDMLKEGNFAAIFFCEEIYKTRLLPPERFSFKAIAEGTFPTSKELTELWLSYLNKL